MSPLDSWLLMVILILAALLVVAVSLWRQAESDRAETDWELRRTKRDLEVALGWEERLVDERVARVPYGVEPTPPRPLLQLIPGGDQ